MARPPSTQAETEFVLAVGARLRRLRAARQLSLRALSRAAGVGHSTIEKIERGSSVPTVALIRKLAVGLGVSALDLLGAVRGAPAVSRWVARNTEGDRPPLSGRSRVRELVPRDAPAPLRFQEIRLGVGATVPSGSGSADGAVLLVVFEGEVEVSAGRRRHQLLSGDSLRLPAGVRHRIRSSAGRRAGLYRVLLAASASTNAEADLDLRASVQYNR